MLKKYYQLTKPGIVRGNLFTTAGGFFLAARGHVDFLHLFLALFGTVFVIASACVFNNFTDRTLDEKMERTKKRALVTGQISTKNALVFASILLFLGLTFLITVNLLTAIVAAFGFVFYVFVYGYWKRKSIHGTLIGSISGATPPVIGYVAVTNSLDLGALLLFLILVMWQMPHFYAIGIFRKDEYAAANLPVLPVVMGIDAAKKQMRYYAIGFILTITLLAVFGYTGFFYLIVMLAVGGIWLFNIFLGSVAIDNKKWATQIFVYSILVLTIFSILISIDFALPF